MRAGDLVVYQAEPGLYGQMFVWRIRHDGRVVCLTDEHELEVFEPHELDPISPKPAAAGTNLNTGWK